MGCTQVEAKKPLNQKQNIKQTQISISQNIENKKEPDKEKLKSKPSNNKVEISNTGSEECVCRL